MFGLIKQNITMGYNIIKQLVFFVSVAVLVVTYNDHHGALKNVNEIPSSPEKITSCWEQSNRVYQQLNQYLSIKFCYH